MPTADRYAPCKASPPTLTRMSRAEVSLHARQAPLYNRLDNEAMPELSADRPEHQDLAKDIDGKMVSASWHIPPRRSNRFEP